MRRISFGSKSYIILKIALILICLPVFFGQGIVTAANQEVVISADSIENNLDYHLIDSGQSGPLIIITAGIHGNEVAGYLAASKLKDYRLDYGRIIIFDRVNAYGIENNQRYFIDGSDLNRKFPGGDQDQASRLAKALFEFIEENDTDLVIDLHESRKCARIDKNYLGQTIITESELILEALNAIFKINQQIDQEDHQFMLESSPVEGSLTWAVNQYLEIPAFTFETCMQLELGTRIDYQVTLVQYLLQEVGVDLYAQE